MNKSELLNALATEAGCTKKQTETVLDALVKTVRQRVLIEGDTLSYPGLGTFKNKFRDEHTARNPSTGQSILAPAVTKVTFKPAPDLVAKN
jgi:DNA-binding protein HU-beta